MKIRLPEAIASFSAALAVILGAMAAHALHDSLEAANRLDAYETAAFYHLTHSIGAFILARAGLLKCAWTILAGVLLFSGSLYLLCLVEGTSFLGPVTPIGGLIMIVAWGAAGIARLRDKG